MIKSLFALGWSSLRVHKLRSLLAILMITVGVGAIIAIVTVAAGVRLALLQGLIEFYHADVVYLQGHTQGEMSFEIPRVFSERDAQRVAELPDVRAVGLAGQLEGGILSNHDQLLPTGRVMAGSTNLGEFFSLKDGRFPQGSGQIVLGSVLAEAVRQMAPNDPVLGQILTFKFLQGGQVKTEEVRVVGIFGQVPVAPYQFGLSGVRDDDAYVSLDHLLPTEKIDGVRVRFVEEVIVRVKAKDVQLQEILQNMRVQITQVFTEPPSDFLELVDERNKQAKENGSSRVKFGFSIIIPAEDAVPGIEEAVGRVASFVGFIGAFALIVGMLGIMAVMVISVTERTREIGVLKAIGATTSAIMQLFLIEAAMLCVWGSALAVVFGAGMSFLVKGLMRLFLESGLEIPFVFLPGWYAGALAGGILVGLTSGLYPAWRAARVDPIIALRSG